MFLLQWTILEDHVCPWCQSSPQAVIALCVSEGGPENYIHSTHLVSTSTLLNLKDNRAEQLPCSLHLHWISLWYPQISMTNPYPKYPRKRLWISIDQANNTKTHWESRLLSHYNVYWVMFNYDVGGCLFSLSYGLISFGLSFESVKIFVKNTITSAPIMSIF